MVCILGLRKHFPPASADRKCFLHATIQKSCGVARAHTACDTHHKPYLFNNSNKVMATYFFGAGCTLFPLFGGVEVIAVVG